MAPFDPNHRHPGHLNYRHPGRSDHRHPGRSDHRHPGRSDHRHPGLAPGSSRSAQARFYSTILALLCFLPAAAFTDYQSGLEAFNAASYDKAMKEWRQVVDAPPSETHPAVYAETLYAIAMLYSMGQGVPQDYNTATIWLRKAADRGHAGAQAKLGYFYTTGIAVEQDYEQAFELFTRAARQGDVDGQYNLGVLYLNGWGTDQDITMGKQYLAAAAAQGDDAAEALLYSDATRPISKPQQSAATGSSADEGEEALQAATPATGSRMSLRESGMTEKLQAESAQPSARQAESAQPSARQAESAQPSARQAESAQPSARQAESAQPSARQAESAQPSARQAESAQSTTPRHSGIAQQLPESTLKSATWILQQAPDNYTIQVIGLSSRSRLETLIEGHEQLAPFATYTIQLNSKPLYILVQGNYADVDAARRARDNFPRSIQKTDQLWIRQFGMIQELMPAEEGQSDGQSDG